MKPRTLLAFFVLLFDGLGASSQPAGDKKLYFGPCPVFQKEMTFDCYHSYDEVTGFLRDAAKQYPGLARVESIGKTYQGRDLWVMTITDFEIGPPEDKPGVWVDGGIDADEVVTTEAALGVVHRLLTTDAADVVELRRTRVFYVAPVVMPDASELHHTTPIRPDDTTLRPWDDDGDGLVDEDGPEDLDGDHEALQMREERSDGDWVEEERDGRLLRRRRPGDEGPFYKLYLEGTDNDGDGKYGEDPAGGIDPNRNYPGNWSSKQSGSGPFAGSETEIRAMVDFVLAHPNIAASHHFHSTGGVVLRPPSVPDWEIPAADLRLYLDLSRRGLEVTGYNLATSVYDWNWPGGSGNNKRGQVWRDREGEIVGWPEERNDHASYPAYGGSIDTLYELFGVLAFANEIYQMGMDDDGDGRIEDVERLRYNDETLKGEAFKDWKPFAHPQLGPVEIGGWRKFGYNNPLAKDLAEEVRKNVEFVLMQAEAAPLLDLSKLEATSLEGGIYRVEATVRNNGYQPTELAITRDRKRATPVRVNVEGGEAVEILSVQAEQDIGTLEGHGEKRVEWIVRADRGGTVTVTAYHPKAGRATAEVLLKR